MFYSLGVYMEVGIGWRAEGEDGGEGGEDDGEEEEDDDDDEDEV